MSIVLTDVCKSFGPKQILDHLNLEARFGETLVVVGGSGAGKSVLLKLIVGLLRPDSGSIAVDGKEVTELDRDALYELRRKVGYVFQFAALFDSMTVGDNVAMGLRRVPGMDDAEVARRVAESLELVELAGFQDRMPAHLSGGQRKRVGLARAIATRPSYILYDEPTTGLDPVTTAVIDRLILKMDAELGVTSIVITHDIASAYRVGDRVAMLYEGRIRQIGTPEEIRSTTDPIVRGFMEGRPELMQEAS